MVLKDVHFKYMKLLLMYMYRGEVSCPQEDLHGLLKTARGLQIRGLVELERKREAEGFLASASGSPIKRPLSDVQDGASTTSCDLDSRGGKYQLTGSCPQNFIYYCILSVGIRLWIKRHGCSVS